MFFTCLLIVSFIHPCLFLYICICHFIKHFIVYKTQQSNTIQGILATSRMLEECDFSLTQDCSIQYFIVMLAVL